MILAVAFVTSGLILEHSNLNLWILPFIFLALSYKLDVLPITALYLAILSPILCLKSTGIHEYALLLLSLTLVLLIYRFTLKPRIEEFLQIMNKGTLEQIRSKLKNLIRVWRIIVLIILAETFCLTLTTGFNGTIFFIFYQSIALYTIQISLVRNWIVAIPLIAAISYPILLAAELGIASYVGLSSSIIMLIVATHIIIKADYYLIKSLMK